MVCMTDTKDHILRTAFSFFINKSYKAVTMSDLEKATGLTKGAFYHYFKSKEEIYIEVIDKYYLANHMPQNEAIEKSGSLLEYISLHVSHIEWIAQKLKETTNVDCPDPTSVSLILEAKIYYPGFNDKLKELGDIIFRKWERVISRAKRNGEIIADVELDILTENFISVGYSVFRYVMISRSFEYAISQVKLQYMQLYKLIRK